MPTLEGDPPPGPGYIDRAAVAVRRAGAVIGADARVPFRLLLTLAVAAACASTAPTPFGQIAVVAVVLIALDVARMKRYDAGRMQ